MTTSSGSDASDSTGSITGDAMSSGKAIIRRGKAKAPASVVEVRRSSRSNKYDSFKIPSVSDSKAKPSKVKPRIVPSAAAQAGQAVPDSLNEDNIPPPTPVQVLQHIGIIKCAIPPEEVTSEALMAEAEDGPSNA